MRYGLRSIQSRSEPVDLSNASSWSVLVNKPSPCQAGVLLSRHHDTIGTWRRVGGFERHQPIVLAAWAWSCSRVENPRELNICRSQGGQAQAMGYGGSYGPSILPMLEESFGPVLRGSASWRVSFLLFEAMQKMPVIYATEAESWFLINTNL